MGTGQLIFSLLACALLLGFGGYNLSSWPAALRYPGEISDIEGRPMTEMVQLRSGVPIYAPATPERYDSANYGVLYYWLGSHLVDVKNPSYRNLRLLSMLATLGCAAICALLTWSFSRNIPASALAAMLFLASPLEHLLAITCRCDMVALFLATSGFLIAYQFRSDRRLLWACPLFALSLGFKQIFVAAPAAVLSYLLIEKRYRVAAEFAAGCALAFAGLILFFQKLIFPGQAVLLHMFKYNVLPFSASRLGYYLLLFAMTLLPAVLVAGDSLHRYRDRLMMLYFGWAFAIAVATVGKEGSSILYFIELVFVACPLIVVLLVSRIKEGDLPAAAQVIALVAVSMALTFFLPGKAGPADFANDAAIQAYLHQHLAAGSSGLSEYEGDLTRAGMESPISDLYQYSWLRCGGQIPRADLVTQVERHRFAAIMVRTDLATAQGTSQSPDLCWTEDLREAIVTNYRLEKTFRAPLPDRHLGYHIWVPR